MRLSCASMSAPYELEASRVAPSSRFAARLNGKHWKSLVLQRSGKIQPISLWTEHVPLWSNFRAIRTIVQRESTRVYELRVDLQSLWAPTPPLIKRFEPQGYVLHAKKTAPWRTDGSRADVRAAEHEAIRAGFCPKALSQVLVSDSVWLIGVRCSPSLLASVASHCSFKVFGLFGVVAVFGQLIKIGPALFLNA